MRRMATVSDGTKSKMEQIFATKSRNEDIKDARTNIN